MLKITRFLLILAAAVLAFSLLAIAQEFGGSVQYTTGDNPGDCFVGPLNSDNRPDIVVTNRGSNTVSVFINRGNSAYYAKVDYAVGTYPSGVHGGDLDDDGDIDLAVCNRSSNSLSILLNNGSGIFTLDTTYAVGTTPDAVFLADVDDDDDLDAITANHASSNITIRYNDGSGNFSAPSNFSTGAGTEPTALFAARFSGDPQDPVSIAVVSDAGNLVIIMENDGYGSFSVGEVDTVAAIPIEIHGTDIDGDDDIDLAVTSWKFADAMTILTNNAGTFTDAAYSTLGGSADVYLDDVDNDDDPDIVAVSYTSVSIALNNGSGSFSQADDLDAPIGGWSAIVAADVNADDDMDLICVAGNSDYVYVIRNKEICCHGRTGNVNWDARDMVDLSDLSLLVGYLEAGATLGCPDEADLNSDCVIDLSDLSILISYLSGGPAPDSCGCGSPKLSTQTTLPTSYELTQNYPNPFNPLTTITFRVPVACHATLEVLNTLGQRVVTLVDSEVAAGTHIVYWNAEKSPSGMYFYRLSSAGFTETKKMILLK